MAISKTIFYDTFICDGVTTDWNFNFRINSEKEMHLFQVLDNVYTPLVYGTDYEVVRNAPSLLNGGIIRTKLAYEAPYKLYAIRYTDITQLEDFIGSGALPPQQVEHALDKLTEICQEISKIARETGGSGAKTLIVESDDSTVRQNSPSEYNEETKAITINLSAEGGSPSPNVKKYVITFDNDDLVDGKLHFNHGLPTLNMVQTLFDGNRNEQHMDIYMGTVEGVIDCSNVTPIEGVWSFTAFASMNEVSSDDKNPFIFFFEDKDLDEEGVITKTHELNSTNIWFNITNEKGERIRVGDKIIDDSTISLNLNNLRPIEGTYKAIVDRTDP